MAHTCHAHKCDRVVPPKIFMCAAHWRALPKPLKEAIWREYQPGQERTKLVTTRYLAVQRRAVGYMAFKPNDEAAARAAAPYMIEAEIYRQMSIDAGGGDPLAHLPGGHTPMERLDLEKARAAVGAIRQEARALGEM